MSASLATLNGQVVTACRVSLHAYGIPWFDVECANDTVLEGAATLVLDDATFVGTIMSKGAYETRTHYRIAGGAGGWGRVVPAAAHANDLGVKISTVLVDAAAACGERLGVVPAGTVGPAFPRAKEPASYVLHKLAGAGLIDGWYIDEAGVTQCGRRPAVAYTGQAARIKVDAAQGRIDLAPSSLVGLVPGAVVDGLEAVDVEHELDATTGAVRTTIWGKGISTTSRLTDGFRRIVETFTAESRFHAPWEYRVVQQTGDKLDLQVVRVSSGMPPALRASLRPGLLGENVDVKLGSLCLVAFINGDRARPIVIAGDYTTPPTLSKLAGGGPASVRVGDTVNAGYLVIVTNSGLFISAVYFAGSPSGAALASAAVTVATGAGNTATMISMTAGHPTSGSTKVQVG